jgi:hypothetical protein
MSTSEHLRPARYSSLNRPVYVPLTEMHIGSVVLLYATVYEFFTKTPSAILSVEG